MARFGQRDTIIMGNWAMVQTPIKAIRFKSRILLADSLTNVAAIAAGYSHTTFLKSNGSVWATGYNNYWATGRWYKRQ